ncbi:hypothetical protein [Thalassoglobus polymorphus]|uniref:Uncharacterized protein n=1 Tax=Thalassoglobus polymorphus TaxID=2527994 RepID=A0A517QMS6_9PLAN|nr:hypothetical protein [Thalassoglobus polymorphus]QDT32946.1 hypothetical protein Mal48_21960 [Thalassoglobus polymorphus]
MFCNSTRMASFVFALFAGLVFTSSGFAQDEDAAASLAKAHEQLRAVLDNTDNLFYKSGKENDGSTFYTVIWEHNDNSVKFIATLKKLGFYDGTDIYGLSLWTYVANEENAVPPAVIKAVATTTDRLSLGSFSCSQDFTKVFANVTASLDGLTPASMWFYAAYLQSNKEAMEGIIEEAMSASGR